ncbi:hypothetical protein G5714_023219 [Onychostoma macrolepis]|uniref:Uncharacterized protein n=1 Tax=Onychostoma macrolepis TaxID=369639 RepID=A0A7J6BL35_9TELE|nr:hypothetical protein G5714_023219 [Onychostoma macrolepis]
MAAAETTGLSSNSSSHEDDVSLNCSTTNEGLSVPCMSAADVEACIEMLNSHPGPLLFTNGEIFRQSEILSWNELRLTREPVCLIKLKGENKIKSCYGVYLGNDYTLTACHTFEFARLYDAYVFFPTTDFVLIYEAELPKEQHMFHDKDQCLVKLLGQTDVLGKGLLDRICAPGKNEDLYFYTFDSQGNRQVHTCKDITHPSAMNEKSQRNELLMSTAAVETTGPSSNSSSHEDDVSLNCSITNEGLSVPCMSAADVEACIEMLNSHPGPLLFTNGEIFRQSEILSWNELRLTREPVCLIKLKRENKIKSCYGVYLGNDYTLTACHTFEFARLYDAYVFFPTTDFVLIYEAELPKEQHMFHDKDQCLVKLLGQTDVLGKGLLNRICAPGKNEDLYFYTFDSQGNRQVHTCKDITHPSAMNEKSQRNELLMSTAGEALVVLNGKES